MNCDADGVLRTALPKKSSSAWTTHLTVSRVAAGVPTLPVIIERVPQAHSSKDKARAQTPTQ